MIRSYDLQIAAGASVTLEVQAQVFDFISSGSAFDVVTVLPDVMQGSVSLKLGQGFDAGKLVNRWIVTNPGTTAINGTAVLSTAGFRNFRISGDVNVLDGGKSRTLGNSAYGGYLAPAAPGAGNYPRLQLWNPANSGKRAMLEQITGYSGAVGALFLESSTAALAGFNEYGQPKLLGGVASVCSLQSDAVAVAPTNPVLFGMPLQAQAQQTIKFSEPIIIPPGTGLLLYGNTAATQIAANFEWYEEPNT